jgi:hypothetical protein
MQFAAAGQLRSSFTHVCIQRSNFLQFVVIVSTEHSDVQQSNVSLWTQRSMLLIQIIIHILQRLISPAVLTVARMGQVT